MEWQLWEGDEPPFFTTQEFFRAHPHIEPVHQVGHMERMEMVDHALDNLLTEHPTLMTLTDLGCGDGYFLDRARRHRVRLEVLGYDAGEANINVARGLGLDVQVDNILEILVISDIVTVTEVLEHLVDPHGFLRNLGGDWLIATSPSGEDDTWHYEHHAWAWDNEGYARMIEDAGWVLHSMYECETERAIAFGPSNVEKTLRFQCVVARRR